jgi:hypothetical protein
MAKKKKMVDSGHKEGWINPTVAPMTIDEDGIVEPSQKEILISVTETRQEVKEIKIPRLDVAEAAGGKYCCISESEAYFLLHCISMAGQHGDEVFARAVGFTMDLGDRLPVSGDHHPMRLRFYEKI